jgi:hypothetical protein
MNKSRFPQSSFPSRLSVLSPMTVTTEESSATGIIPTRETASRAPMPRTKFAKAAAESSAGRSHPCRRTIDPHSPRTTTTTARSTPAHSLVGGIRRSPPPPCCPNSRARPSPCGILRPPPDDAYG